MKTGSGIRTDLAIEIREQLDEELGSNGEIPGVALNMETDPDSGISVSIVTILNEKGEKAMGKPCGTYITIETGSLSTQSGDAREEAAQIIAKYLYQLTQNNEYEENRSNGILVVGLGNREITPDALGPLVVDKLLVTRHVFREFQKMFPETENSVPISALAPGVMGQTGMEASEIIKGVVKETKPSLVLVIDALAARDSGRLNKTVQMTDTGISPGAGVGNYRNEINRRTLGVPVIAIGVPTVIDEATIVRDRMERCLQENGLNEAEIRQFLQMLREDTDRLFVTPKDIDEAIRRIGEILADAINSSFSHT